MIHHESQPFEAVMAGLGKAFLEHGQHDKVDTRHWQSLQDVPHVHTRELRNVVIERAIPTSVNVWQLQIQPNLPWAENHFRERVSGLPLNPGKEYKNWPWYKGGVEDHKEEGFFSHTYMERMWPKVANKAIAPTLNSGAAVDDDTLAFYHDQGIRFKLGDTGDLLRLLAQYPTTRQAYLPIWFPEDLWAAAIHGERVPCSLGYHFLLRDGLLHCNYFMRSVDYLRYLRDDLYLAGRLTQWVLKQLAGKFNWEFWADKKPGTLTLFASSLHVFEGDVPKLRSMYETKS